MLTSIPSYDRFLEVYGDPEAVPLPPLVENETASTGFCLIATLGPDAFYWIACDPTSDGLYANGVVLDGQVDVYGDACKPVPGDGFYEWVRSVADEARFSTGGDR